MADPADVGHSGSICSPFTSSAWDASCSYGWLVTDLDSSDLAMQAVHRHQEEARRGE